MCALHPQCTKVCFLLHKAALNGCFEAYMANMNCRYSREIVFPKLVNCYMCALRPQSAPIFVDKNFKIDFAIIRFFFCTEGRGESSGRRAKRAFPQVGNNAWCNVVKKQHWKIEKKIDLFLVIIATTPLTKFSLLLLFAKKATKGASKERLSKLEARDFDGVSADSKSRGQGRTRTFGFLLLALLLSNYFLLFGSSIGCSIMPIDVKFITKRKKRDHLDH